MESSQLPHKAEGPGRTDPYSLARDNAQEPFISLTDISLLLDVDTQAGFPVSWGRAVMSMSLMLCVKAPPAT